MYTFNSKESNVRSYIRSFPAVFDTAKNSLLYDEDGGEYIDFFAGAGTLNYGHNNPVVSNAIIEYLQRNGIVHSLDKATVAKRNFIEKFTNTILKPRNLNYKLQFTGPTGTNSVEAAIKLARKVKNRYNIVSFTNGYHGLTFGSLGLTANSYYRSSSLPTKLYTETFPFDGYLDNSFDTIRYLRKKLTDNGSGTDLPAAVIVETIQGEGGINIASKKWLCSLQLLCQELDILLIIDDIQMGNGRTGTFFSFENFGIKPDMVCLSKSIGGGLPMALLLIDPELDIWQPGEHTGTFRGNNLAFVAATELLDYWSTNVFSESIEKKSEIIKYSLQSLKEEIPELKMKIKGKGLVWGVDFMDKRFTSMLSKAIFKKQLLLETCGSNGTIFKFLPPLTIEEELLIEGLERFSTSVKETWLFLRENISTKNSFLAAAN